MLWPHIIYIDAVSDTSNRPQNCFGDYLGPLDQVANVGT